MGIATPAQTSFSGGEISPLALGRVDQERYRESLAVCKNWIPRLQGPLIRRPGTRYVANVKGGAPTLIPFQYSTTQAYVLEFGYFSGGYIRFYTNYGVVLSAGVPYEVAHPYLANELSSIRYVQSADVLYLVHPNHAPYILSRLGATNWTMAPMTTADGPYLDPVNSTPALSLGISATTGSITVTANPVISMNGTANNGSGAIRLSFAVALPTGYLQEGSQMYVSGVVGTTEANGTWVIHIVDSTHIDLVGSTFVNAYVSGGTIQPAIFASTDVGRQLRLESSSNWGWVTITGYTNPGSVTALVQATLSGSGQSAYAFGAWGATTGYPSVVTFFQDRLCFGGTLSRPQRLDCSMTSNYQTFSPSALTGGAIQDNDAISFNLNAEDVNAIYWLNSDEQGILAGSAAAEWSITPSTAGSAFSLNNINASRATKWGSAPLPSVHIGRSTVFIERGARKLRELTYSYYLGGYSAVDLTEFADHIMTANIEPVGTSLGVGVTTITYQRLPIPVIWMGRADGSFVGLSYEREMQQVKAGWHQHALGGQSDPSGTPPIVSSMVTIPDPTGTQDDVWMVVQRYINGQSISTIEYVTRIFQEYDDQEHATFLDCANTFDNPKSFDLGGFTLGNPSVITCTGHGLSTGNQVRIYGATGVLLNGQSLINQKVFTVTVIDSNNFSIPVNTTGAIPYYSRGTFRKLVTTISGLSYLQGETVSIYADGCVVPAQTVSGGGTITLTNPAAIVTVGYPYTSQIKMLRLEQGAGSRNGVALGKNRRTHRVGILVDRSLGLYVGKSFSATDLSLCEMRTQGVDLNDVEVPLYTGVVSKEMDFDYDFDNQLCFQVTDPVPCTILAVMPMVEVQDRA